MGTISAKRDRLKEMNCYCKMRPVGAVDVTATSQQRRPRMWRPHDTKLFQLFLFMCFTVRASRAILNGGSVFGGGDSAIPPRFISHGNTFRVVTGDTVVLPCEVQNLGSYLIVWRKGASLLSAGQQMISRDNRLSLATGGTGLQLRDIRHPDQGDYTCQIGDGSSGDLIHTVEILMPPSIQMVPPTGQTTTRKGGPVSFECRVSGNPSPVVQWSKKDGLLPSGVQVQQGYVLTLTDVQRQHGGVYQCTASNGIGQPVTSEVRLHVLYPPEVSVIRSWVNSGEGLEAKLDCLVHADPPAEVLWYHDSFLIQATDRRIMSSQGITHTLTIRNLQHADYGNYSCTVVNSIGREKKYIELSGRPGPPTVSSPGYSQPHEYNLTWVVQSVFPVAEVNATYHHPGQWHDLLVRPQHQWFDPNTGERHQSYRLAQLHGDAVYECLVQAKNQHGFGDLSDLHQWVTSQRGAPPSSVGGGIGSKGSGRAFDTSDGRRVSGAGWLWVSVFVIMICELFSDL